MPAGFGGLGRGRGSRHSGGCGGAGSTIAGCSSSRPLKVATRPGSSGSSMWLSSCVWPRGPNKSTGELPWWNEHRLARACHASRVEVHRARPDGSHLLQCLPSLRPDQRDRSRGRAFDRRRRLRQQAVPPNASRDVGHDALRRLRSGRVGTPALASGVSDSRGSRSRSDNRPPRASAGCRGPERRPRPSGAARGGAGSTS